ncbi:MAG: tetratricopeptide repeat protein [Boseongicola sp.]|nr:tetratricopeptide repeat protein [Boseongicola sp.]MDD9977949.1 tetratricopeptide repeat protein [Boseongicola sp.]
MRRVGISFIAISSLALVACNQGTSDEEVERALQDVNVIDETNLNDIMLTAADPNEAVTYFQRTLAANPTRVDLKRGLAISLVRAGKPTAAVSAWQAVLEDPGATNDDRVDYADALIRANQWDRAEAQLDEIPPTHETFKRYRLEAMVADSNKEWKKADSFYEIAVGLTTKPSGTLNNWGFSKLTRGDYAEAERLFGEALTYNSDMFTAKNNLVLARAAQRRYEMPVVPMTQIERAQLLHTAALSAIKQGDINTGKSLLREAIDTHPQYFEAAVRSLEALDNSATN